MIYEHRVTLNPLVYEWHSAPSYWEPFGTGHIHALASGWAFQGYLEAPGAIDWALAAVPQFPAGRRASCSTTHGTSASTTQHPDEAWEVVKFLTSPEAMEHFVLKTRTGRPTPPSFPPTPMAWQGRSTWTSPMSSPSSPARKPTRWRRSSTSCTARTSSRGALALDQRNDPKRTLRRKRPGRSAKEYAGDRRRNSLPFGPVKACCNARNAWNACRLRRGVPGAASAARREA